VAALILKKTPNNYDLDDQRGYLRRHRHQSPLRKKDLLLLDLRKVRKRQQLLVQGLALRKVGSGKHVHSNSVTTKPFYLSILLSILLCNSTALADVLSSALELEHIRVLGTTSLL